MRIKWLLILIVLISSCTRKVYVENTKIEKDTVYLAKWHIDSILNSDTITIREKGDSVFIDKVRWRWRIKESRDTVYQWQSQYVEKPVPYEVVKEVNVVTWWQKWLMGWGVISMLFMLIIFAKRLFLKKYVVEHKNFT